MYPKNEYANLIEKKIKKIKLKKFKTFKYNPNPEVLTGEIETFNKLFSKKRNLELRKKCLKIKRMKQSIKELERLDQLYTLGDVNFDSVNNN